MPTKNSNNSHLFTKQFEPWMKTLDEFSRAKFRVRKNQSTRDWLWHNLLNHQKDIRNLWETFNQERSQLKQQLLSTDAQAHAYFLGFHLFNYERCRQILNRLDIRYNFKSILSRHDLNIQLRDLGCGSGAMSQAILEHYESKNFEQIYLIDSSKKILNYACTLLQNMGHKNYKPIKTSLNDLKPIPHGQNQIVFYSLGYAWNEIFKNTRTTQNMIKSWHQHIQKDELAAILFIDSANEHFAKNMQRLRNDLSNLGYHVLYPCPALDSCPMISKPKDWCFSTVNCQLPTDYYEQFDKVIGTQHKVLSLSAYFMISPKLANTLKLQNNPKTILVGKPLGKDRKTQLLLCEQGGQISKKIPNNIKDLSLNRGDFLESSRKIR